MGIPGAAAPSAIEASITSERSTGEGGALRPLSDLSRAELEQELQALRLSHATLRASHTKLLESQESDQKRLRSLESQMLLNDQKRAASSRRRRVSGVLALIGIGLIVVNTPLTLAQTFGSFTDGAFGYCLSLVISGGSIALLGAMPTDAPLVRAIAALYTSCAFVFGSTYFFAFVPLAWTGTHCTYDSTLVCKTVAVALGISAVVLYAAAVGWVWTLRQGPEGHKRLPVSDVWKSTRARLGPLLAAASFLLAAPIVWAVVQPESSFAMSPRVALKRIWLVFRVACMFWGSFFVGAVAYMYVHGETEPVVPSMVYAAALFYLNGLATTARNRARVHEALGKLGTRDEANAAAVVAAVVGGIPAKEAYEKAQSHFSGIAFSSLTFDDFLRKDLAAADAHNADLKARTRKRNLGEVDVFLSHSWHDPVKPKWAALRAWARKFEEAHKGHSPVLWLDKACIDQNNISESLACLPIFLSGCKKLLVIAGNTYTHRLWCVMEIFTFLFMGGHINRIVLLPISEKPVPAVVAPEEPDDDEAPSLERVSTFEEGSYDSPEMRQVLDAFANFDARRASCFIEKDKQCLLGVIETGLGSLDAFNAMVHSIFDADKAVLTRRGSSGDLIRIGVHSPAQKERSKRGSCTASFLRLSPRSSCMAEPAANAPDAQAGPKGSFFGATEPSTICVGVGPLGARCVPRSGRFTNIPSSGSEAQPSDASATWASPLAMIQPSAN